ncbi:MAG: NUDIX hydrolase [Chloroflexia bacterium]
MSTPPFKTYTVTSGIVRRGGEVLLIHQFRSRDPYPNWFLPGGRVEPGELLSAGLVRELKEETGLDVVEVGPVAYFSHSFVADENSQVLAYVFEIAEWRGSVQVADPDGVVSEARFYPLEEAIALIAHIPWHSMKVPLTAYLRGKYPAGTVWMYSNKDKEGEPYPVFAGRLPGNISDIKSEN